MFNKTNDDWDCRAISSEFLAKFCDGAEYYPFVELVKEYSELELCFRGNDYSNKKPLTGGKVCIYRNNHAMFTITSKTLYFNPNYLRYCKDWPKILDKLVDDYGFKKGKEFKLIVKKNKNYSCSFSHNQISVSLTGEFLENLSKKVFELYDLLTKVFDDFFSVERDKSVDRFLEWSNKNIKEYENKIEPEYYENHKKIELEKIRQQQLYSIMQFQKGGYYFYDMEFQQKHKNIDERKAEKARGESNKPDMQAIRFDKDGKPEALVFVEVKCTKSAYYGDKSGLDKHIKAMLKYPAEGLIRRRREAYMILHQYEQLGLRKFERKIDYREYTNLPLEIILVFTDEAINLWKNDNSNEIIKIKSCECNQFDNKNLLDNDKEFLLVKVPQNLFAN